MTLNSKPNAKLASFFISYNKRDQAWAEWIAWQLESDGYRTTLQAWDFMAGSNFVLEMDKALKQADHVIAILSADYLASDFSSTEWAARFVEDPTAQAQRLIPVRVHEIGFRGLLSPIVYVDLVGKNEEQARRELLAKLKLERMKPDQPPSFPGKKDKPKFPGFQSDPGSQQLPSKPIDQIDNGHAPSLLAKIFPQHGPVAILIIGLVLGALAGYFTRGKLDDATRLRAERKLLEVDRDLSVLIRDYEAFQHSQGNREAVNSQARELLKNLLSINDINLSAGMQILKYEHVCYTWGIIAGSDSDSQDKPQAAESMLKACDTARAKVAKVRKIEDWMTTDYTEARINRLYAVGLCTRWQVNPNDGDLYNIRDIVNKLPANYVNKEHPEKTGELQPCLPSSSSK